MTRPEQSVVSFEPRQSDTVHKHRRESSFRRQISLVDLDDGAEVVCVRWYGKGERAYCCVWIHWPGHHARGSGWAGGYGYHKDSAAMQSAMRDAGIVFAQSFDGVGSTGEDDALRALVHWLDVPRFVLVKAHP